MKAGGSEIKWGLCGFIAGFALCYIVVFALKAPPAQRRVALIRTTTGVSPRHFIIDLGSESKDQRLIPVDSAQFRDNPFKADRALRNVPPGALPKDYSVDLIDGRDHPPSLN